MTYKKAEKKVDKFLEGEVFTKSFRQSLIFWVMDGARLFLYGKEI